MPFHDGAALAVGINTTRYRGRSQLYAHRIDDTAFDRITGRRKKKSPTMKLAWEGLNVIMPRCTLDTFPRGTA